MANENKTDGNKRGPFLQHLDDLEAVCKDGKGPSIWDIVTIFGAEGHYVLMLFLIVPFLQPIPLFGLSTPFGLFIGLVAALAYLGKPPWLPRRWREKIIAAQTVVRIAEGTEQIFKKLSFFVRPRWAVFLSGFFHPLNTLLLIINAVLLALPLPIPFSNAIPAWIILFQALAYLERDGLLVLLSYLQMVGCVFYFAVIAKGVGLGVYFLWGLF